ncbi:S1 family peptidase [Nostoc sp.]|uniref:S1 family peptidase n=1 Tax=Nostoc sp. TaxID=1180 RepID=UPI002FF55CBA
MSSFLLILPQQAFTLESPANNKTPIKQLQRSEIDEWEVKEIARSITVKISSDYNNIPSSGILIDKQERKLGEQSVYLYLVLTNNHVVRDKKANYKVETPDGRIYKASLYSEYSAQFGDDIDLDLLYFSSTISYEKAQIGNSSSIKNEDKVFVGGFACPDSRFCEKQSKFIFEPGTALLLDKPLVRHYQIAYTSNTKDGTSGGVVLNKKGELIAINGQAKYALGNDQYSYTDGKQPSPEVIKFMRHFAWGIPINTYKEYSLEAPLDKIKLPTPSAIIKYITIPANINNQNSWLNNTNIILFIFGLVIVYLLIELRKSKVNEKLYQERLNQANAQEIVHLKCSEPTPKSSTVNNNTKPKPGVSKDNSLSNDENNVNN